MFLKTINYELDPIKDKVFVHKLRPFLTNEKVVMLLPYLTVPKDALDIDFPLLEKSLIEVLGEINDDRNIFFSQIVINGLYMDYWSQSFLDLIYDIRKKSLTYFLNQCIKMITTNITKNNKKEPSYRSKLEIIFEESLLEYGYNFESNVRMGVFELDFVIGGKIVV